MSFRGLYVFTHDNPLGSAPAHCLFDRVSATLREEIRASSRVPRSFGDYEIIVDDQELPEGITLTKLLG